MVAGPFRKRDSRLLDVDFAKARKAAEASLSHFFQAGGYDPDRLEERFPDLGGEKPAGMADCQTLTNVHEPSRGGPKRLMQAMPCARVDSQAVGMARLGSRQIDRSAGYPDIKGPDEANDYCTCAGERAACDAGVAIARSGSIELSSVRRSARTCPAPVTDPK